MQQLKFLVSVSETMNFSETAKKNYITQPAVSHQIKALEEELGAMLLFRKGHSVVFTAEGLAFLEYAMEILDLENQARTVVRSMALGSQGYLKIAALPTLKDELELCLNKYAAAYPQIHVTVDQMEGGEFLKSFVEESYDFYFGLDHLFTSGQKCESVVTMKTDLRLYAGNEAAPCLNINNPRTLESFPFVSVNPSDPVLTSQIESVCERLDFHPDIINFYNRIELVPMAVSAGIGLAILPAAVEYVYPYPNVTTLEIACPEAELEHMIAWRKLKSSSAIKFKNVIKDIYG